MLDLRSRQYLSANATATTLLQRLVGGATERELVEELVEKFDIDDAVATSDTAEFLAALEREGLLTADAG